MREAEQRAAAEKRERQLKEEARVENMRREREAAEKRRVEEAAEQQRRRQQQEFEAVADQFFAEPATSVCGWETAEDAQRRIVAEVEACLVGPQDGDILFVGHGGVGTLLFCALSGIGIDRRFDQGPGGGGCWFAFDSQLRRPQCEWQPMEAL